MNNYHDWQQRVVEERDELAQKIAKLAAFMCGAAFTKQEEGSRNLLHNQLNHMNAYLCILDARIDRFMPENEQ